MRVDGTLRYSHRIAYARDRNIPIEELDGILIRHKCDNPSCVNPDHLEEGYPIDNSNDMVIRGRNKLGSSRPGSILTEEIVSDMRERYTGSRGQITSLSKEYGISLTAAWMAIKGVTWKHVEEKE